MRKIYGSILLSLLIFSASLFGNDVRYGYISSFSLPWYSGSGWDRTLEATGSAENNPIVGFSLGIMGEKSLNPLFSIRGALMVTAAGGGMALDVGEEESAAILISEINLDIPFVVKWHFFREGRGSLYLVGGPQASIHLYQAEFIQDGAEFEKISLERSQFTSLGFGALGGMGLDVSGWRFSVFLEVNYLREFNRTMDSSGPVYQNAVSFTSGIRWRELLR